MKCHGNISAAVVGFLVACALFLHPVASSTALAQTTAINAPPLQLHPGINLIGNNTSVGEIGIVLPNVWFLSVPPQATTIKFMILPEGSNNTGIDYTVTPAFTPVSGSVFPNNFYNPFGTGFPAPTIDCSELGIAFQAAGVTIRNVAANAITAPAIVNCKNLPPYIMLATNTPTGIGTQKFAFYAIVGDAPVSGDTSPCQASRTEHFSACSPTELNVNALTLPISGTTALSNIVDTRGVKEATLIFSCTQTVTVNLGIYDENGTVIQFGGAIAVTGTAVASTSFHMGSEILASGGDGSVPKQTGAAIFPQRAISFSFTNSTANAGTCTARLYLAY